MTQPVLNSVALTAAVAELLLTGATLPRASRVLLQREVLHRLLSVMRPQRFLAAQAAARLAADPRIRGLLAEAIALLAATSDGSGQDENLNSERIAASELGPLVVQRVIKVRPPLRGRRWPLRWVALAGILAKEMPAVFGKDLLAALGNWLCRWIEDCGQDHLAEDGELQLMVLACQVISSTAAQEGLADDAWRDFGLRLQAALTVLLGYIRKPGFGLFLERERQQQVHSVAECLCITAVHITHDFGTLKSWLQATTSRLLEVAERHDALDMSEQADLCHCAWVISVSLEVLASSGQTATPLENGEATQALPIGQVALVIGGLCASGPPALRPALAPCVALLLRSNGHLLYSYDSLFRALQLGVSARSRALRVRTLEALTSLFARRRKNAGNVGGDEDHSSIVREVAQRLEPALLGALHEAEAPAVASTALRALLAARDLAALSATKLLPAIIAECLGGAAASSERAYEALAELSLQMPREVLAAALVPAMHAAVHRLATLRAGVPHPEVGELLQRDSRFSWVEEAFADLQEEDDARTSALQGELPALLHELCTWDVGSNGGASAEARSQQLLFAELTCGFLVGLAQTPGGRRLVAAVAEDFHLEIMKPVLRGLACGCVGCLWQRSGVFGACLTFVVATAACKAAGVEVSYAPQHVADTALHLTELFAAVVTDLTNMQQSSAGLLAVLSRHSLLVDQQTQQPLPDQQQQQQQHLQQQQEQNRCEPLPTLEKADACADPTLPLATAPADSANRARKRPRFRHLSPPPAHSGPESPEVMAAAAAPDLAADAAGSNCWKAFTPSKVDHNGCMARTWAGGAGGQCVRLRGDGLEFCHWHNNCQRWRCHGRVDGPIPEVKLNLFQRARLRSAKFTPAPEKEACPCEQVQLPGKRQFDGEDEAQASEPCDVKQLLLKRQRQEAMTPEKACCFGA
jgi:hypothetical protein